MAIEMTYLLPELQDLEALKVIELLPLLVLSALLCPAAFRPLAVHFRLFPCLLHSANSGAAGKLGENNRGERQVSEGCGVSGNGAILGGSVNEHLPYREQTEGIYNHGVPIPACGR